ncbi:MAG: hypothetical protein D6812_06500 [Deltaproteobacteria bacterium]|nr:MAG: hypothetical protein D6812_06500 [Deltaproteobacteria bacterium]
MDRAGSGSWHVSARSGVHDRGSHSTPDDGGGAMSRKPETTLKLPQRLLDRVSRSLYQKWVEFPADLSFPDFLDHLRRAPRLCRPAIAERFRQGHASPYVAGESATFFYVGSAKEVCVAGDFNHWQPHHMKRVAGAPFFHLTRRFPPKARLDYKLVIDGAWHLDPNNPRQVPGGYGPNSELRMPGYTDPPSFARRKHEIRGTLRFLRLESKIYQRMRSIILYLPPGYTQERAYPALYIHDGGEYLSLAGLHLTVEGMIERGEIEPLVLVLIPPLYRTIEYAMNRIYERFIVKEVVPFAEREAHLSPTPQDRGLLGPSLGGLISTFIALRNPDTFGRVIGQSSAFQWQGGKILDLVRKTERQPIEFVLDCGIFEGIIQINRRMRDLLQAKGYPLAWAEYPEGHSWGSWRAHAGWAIEQHWGRKRQEKTSSEPLPTETVTGSHLSRKS